MDQIPPNVLVSNCVTKTFDFLTCSEADLQRISIPLSLQVAVPCTGKRACGAARCRAPCCTRLAAAAPRRARPAGPRAAALFPHARHAPRQPLQLPAGPLDALPLPACPAVHGVASWFDVLFDGTQSQRWLSTAPGLPITHWWAAPLRPLRHALPCWAGSEPDAVHAPWPVPRARPKEHAAHCSLSPPGCRFQLRCLMEHPVVVTQPGATVSGELRLEAHNRQSYDVHVTLRAPPLAPGGPEQVGTVFRGGLGGAQRSVHAAAR